MADITIQFPESDYNSILRQAVAVLPWGHTLKLMQKFGNDDEAILYYAKETTAKPIGVADYQLIIPQEELKRVVADELESFSKELPHRTGFSLLDSEYSNEEN